MNSTSSDPKQAQTSLDEGLFFGCNVTGVGFLSELRDSFGRNFHYLRLSVTDACNFRCGYCLPNGYKRDPEDLAEPLTVFEISRLVRAFGELGFWKVRLTGGEPTLRKDILEIAEQVSATPGIRVVAFSTNGFRLEELAEPLHRAGVSKMNVSLDALDADAFQRVTQSRWYPKVMAGLEKALSVGFESVKINAVLMKGLNENSLTDFLEFTKHRAVSIRFIELMPTVSNRRFFQDHHISSEAIGRILLERGWTENPRRPGDGPAREFSHPNHQGCVGLIAPYSKDFCSTCNRLRVLSKGQLRLCLFGEKTRDANSFDLRPFLQADSSLEPLKEKIRGLIEKKEVSHFLSEGRVGDTPHLASMGG